MKINLYKIDEIYSFEVISNKLELENYSLTANKTIEGIKYRIFLNEKNRNSIEWLEEIRLGFGFSQVDIDLSKIYNAIVLIQSSKKRVYGLSFGHSFHKLQKFCDPNFAMDFAEREIKADKIDIKSTSFIQSMKIKELINFKKDSMTFDEPGESYKFVSGVPLNDNIFGRKIDCGFSIQFSKKIKLENATSLKSLNKFIANIDTVLDKKETINTFPRIRYIGKKHSESLSLDNLLLRELKQKKSEFDINYSAFNIIGSRIFFNTCEYNYSIFYYGEKRKICYEMDSFSNKEIENFFNDFGEDEKISNLNKIMIEFKTEGEEPYTRSLKDIIFSEMEFEGKRYILDNGLWGEYNTKFLELLTHQLNNISENYIENNPIFNLSYSNEDNYIEQIVKNPNFIQLHRKTVNIDGQAIELADLYDSKKNELIAVKLGKDMKDLSYTFDQAINSVKCLENMEEYQLKSKLNKHTFSAEIIDNICSSIQNSIILGLTSVTHKKNIENGTFNLNQFKSLLIKLKIIAWVSFMNDSNFNFRLYIQRVSKIT